MKNEYLRLSHVIAAIWIIIGIFLLYFVYEANESYMQSTGRKLIIIYAVGSCVICAIVSLLTKKEKKSSSDKK